MTESRSNQKPESSFEPRQSKSSSSSGASKNAAAELKDLIERYNRQHGTDAQPSLNDVIYIMLRIAEDTKHDPRFAGGWASLVKEVRRRFFARINMAPARLDGHDAAEDPEV